MADLLLGVDTGGTNTDGVLLDYESRQVLATTKTPTTPHDLRICILQALDGVMPDDPGRIRLVAISTTLATNAIAEGKGRPVGLLLFGYDAELVERFEFESRFPADRIAYLAGGHDLNGNQQSPLDEEELLGRAREWQPQVEALAVSGYFSPLNPSHEELAASLIQRELQMPVVLGHQLSRRLNSVERATTAALNASLCSLLREFIEAMEEALDRRGIEAPLMVVRGDAALTRAELAADRPVETVHSGPVASAVGGSFLADRARGLVVDIGGTTTDLAIVEEGRIRVREEGTTVGRYRTAVRAANVRSLGLGGDSVIGLDAEDRLTIGPSRVMPLSQLAAQDARVAADLKGRAGSLHRRPAPDTIEYWYLLREPSPFQVDGRAAQVVELLHQRPWSMPALLERLGLIHPIQFGGGRLIREGIIGRAALTPTDLLHVSGEFTGWDASAAGVATDFMALLTGMDPPALVGAVKERIAQRVVAEVVSYISGHDVARGPSYSAQRNLGSWLFEENVEPTNPYLRSMIELQLPLIGIGAPAAIFLPRVAELLHTELILPPHYGVANAVGAVVGSVVVSKEAWVFPQIRNMHIAGYYAQLREGRERFASLETALEEAQAILAGQAEAEARRAGAVDPILHVERVADGVESYRLRVQATGNPKLGTQGE